MPLNIVAHELDQPIIDRISDRLIRVLDCLLWQGSTTADGHALASVGGRTMNVPRFICAIVHDRDIADHTWITRHTCGAASCLNPAHLIPATQGE